MAQYVQEMMYFGTRIRPVADVVAEAMEAEDASVVNHYVTFLLAHAFDTQDTALRRQCNEIRRAHGWRPFVGPPASANNLPRRSEEDVAPTVPPPCLSTPQAEALWQRLRQAGFIQLGGYRPSADISANQATYIASCMADCLHITPKWKPFQALWGIRNMAQMAGAWAQTGKLPPRAKDIDRALK